jgi:signal transduction histidine kinase
VPTSRSTLPFAAPLESPLPAELTGRRFGWFTGYRRFAVFSAPWARGRVRSSVTLALLALAATGVLTVSVAGDLRPLGGLITLSALLLVPLVAGPWAGVWVRRRGWPARIEWGALCLAVVLVSVASGLLQWGLGEPVRRAVAHATGSLDEEGRRKPFQLFVGIHLTGEPEVDSLPPTDPAAAHRSHSVDAAIAGFFLAGGLALWGWVRERRALHDLAREHELTQAQARRQQAEMRLSVLAAQVEPHFLFNTLAGVRSAIATDPQRASELIDRLTAYLRATIPRLRGDGAGESTLASQAEVVRTYLALMRARLPRMSFDIEVPADLVAARCPPLMLLSLAENAVKHGVEPKIGPAHVTFRAAQEPSPEGPVLVLDVEDDGVGFGQAVAGTGIGLTNIREQLAQLYGGRATLSLVARPQSGVRATLRLPLESASAPTGA